MSEKKIISSMSCWSDEFEGAVTICNLEGIITYMNETSKRMFSKDGETDLIGKSLIECHPEPSRSKLIRMLKSPESNTYTIEKRGIRKIIHQSPLFEKGIFSGVVEISIILPQPLPHFNRN